MNLVLLMVFACVVLGLWTPRLGRRTHVIIGLLAVIITALYFFFSARFMT